MRQSDWARSLVNGVRAAGTYAAPRCVYCCVAPYTILRMLYPYSGATAGAASWYFLLVRANVIVVPVFFYFVFEICFQISKVVCIRNQPLYRCFGYWQTNGWMDGWMARRPGLIFICFRV